jgi:hypothetical protein
MSDKPKHRKHAKLKLRSNEIYAPNEIALLGTSCDKIAVLAETIARELPEYRIAYFDASHDKEKEVSALTEYTFHTNGSLTTTEHFPVNKFNQRIQFASYDLVLINGNHYKAAKQVLLLDPKKEASVQKRLSQLTAVQFVVKVDAHAEFFEFFLLHLTLPGSTT